MSKAVKFNLAHRNLLAALIRIHSGLNELSTDDTVHVADLTDALSLDSVEDLVSDLDIQNRRAYVEAARVTEAIRKEISTWETQHKDDQVPQRLINKLYKAEDKERSLPQAVSYKHLQATEPQEFELQNTDIEWLMDILAKFKWNVRLVRNQQGAYESAKVPLSLEEAVAVRSLRAVLKSAMV